MLSYSKISKVSLVSTAALALMACGGMSETDLREGMDESAVAKGEESAADDADEVVAEEHDADSSQAAAPEQAGEADEDVSSTSVRGQDVEDDSDLVVEVDVTVSAPGAPVADEDEPGAAEGDGDEVAPEELEEEAAPIVIPEIPGPAILGSPSDMPIDAVPVPPEQWVPPEGLGGVEQSGVELEVVDDLSVLVIFDNSGSMNTHWDGRTRWEAANQSLYAALAPVWSSLKVAAVRFPMETECGVPDFGAEAQFGWNLAGDFLEEWIADALAPVGGTPLGSAFIAADAAIAEASERGLLEDRFNVLLITDGEPNCATEKALLTELPAKWLSMGVKTHVLGLPGSGEAEHLLNAIAVAGGTAEPIAVGTSEQLDDEVLVRAR